MGEFDDCDAIDEAASEERWVLDLQDRLAAAEQRAAAAEAEVFAWRDALLARVRERLSSQDLDTDHIHKGRQPEHQRWRVVSHAGVVGVGMTEVEALLNALEAGLNEADATARTERRRAAVAEAALRQAQEDARLVAGLAYALDQNEFFSDVLGSAGLAYEERRRMDVLCSKFARAPHDETVAALRRILASVPR